MTTHEMRRRLDEAMAAGPEAMAALLATAIENSGKQLEAQQRAAAAAVEAVDAQPLPNRVAIRLTGRRGASLYVTGVSFADGLGYKIKKVQYGAQRDKAFNFSAGAGSAIARQLAASGYVGVTMEAF
jgi:hypothetical protein